MKKNEQMTFEEAMAKLEEIVRMLENGKEGLEASLSSFEEGIALVKYCNEKLTKAEQKVRILMQGEGGELQEVDFPTGDA
ncbi:MAG: exodeoxyribonuclease VII small subunit [Clostridia bacterium]|nr:exodeoxyribonuclease VII small subunit [Clostridia bacterium]